MKVCKNVKKPNTRHTKLRIVNLAASLVNDSNFNQFVDDIPPKTTEKVTLHKVISKVIR